MRYNELRNEIKNYYSKTSYKNAKKYLEDGTQKLDEMYNENMSSYDMKVLQYKTIAKIMKPILFENAPFYFETGIIPGFSDGSRDYHGNKHIGGWAYRKNFHKFIDQDPELWELSCRQRSELFYLLCGAYNDDSQHFLVNHRPIFEKGLKGVYKEAQDALNGTDNAAEKQFLSAICEGLLCVKK